MRFAKYIVLLAGLSLVLVACTSTRAPTGPSEPVVRPTRTVSVDVAESQLPKPLSAYRISSLYDSQDATQNSLEVGTTGLVALGEDDQPKLMTLTLENGNTLELSAESSAITLVMFHPSLWGIADSDAVNGLITAMQSSPNFTRLVALIEEHNALDIPYPLHAGYHPEIGTLVSSIAADIDVASILSSSGVSRFGQVATQSDLPFAMQGLEAKRNGDRLEISNARFVFYALRVLEGDSRGASPALVNPVLKLAEIDRDLFSWPPKVATDPETTSVALGSFVNDPEGDYVLSLVRGNLGNLFASGSGAEQLAAWMTTLRTVQVIVSLAGDLGVGNMWKDSVRVGALTSKIDRLSRAFSDIPRVIAGIKKSLGTAVLVGEFINVAITIAVDEGYFQESSSLQQARSYQRTFENALAIVQGIDGIVNDQSELDKFYEALLGEDYDANMPIEEVAKKFIENLTESNTSLTFKALRTDILFRANVREVFHYLAQFRAWDAIRKGVVKPEDFYNLFFALRYLEDGKLFREIFEIFVGGKIDDLMDSSFETALYAVGGGFSAGYKPFSAGYKAGNELAPLLYDIASAPTEVKLNFVGGDLLSSPRPYVENLNVFSFPGGERLYSYADGPTEAPIILDSGQCFRFSFSGYAPDSFQNSEGYFPFYIGNDLRLTVYSTEARLVHDRGDGTFRSERLTQNKVDLFTRSSVQTAVWEASTEQFGGDRTYTFNPRNRNEAETYRAAAFGVQVPEDARETVAQNRLHASSYDAIRRSQNNVCPDDNVARLEFQYNNFLFESNDIFVLPIVVNKAPEVTFVNYDSQDDLSYEFNIEASDDAYLLEELSFEWDFGDGTRRTYEGARGLGVFHRYTKPAVVQASYDVSVTVSDPRGLSTSLDIDTFVIGDPPEDVEAFGRVLDALSLSERPIDGAAVSLYAPNDDQPSYQATSGADGVFVFDAVTPRDYTLTINKDGFRDLAISGVSILPGQSNDLGAFELTVENISRPVITDFSASPASITAGERTTLSWTVSNYKELIITSDVDPDVIDIEVTDSTSYSVSPSETTTYTLTATNDAGTVTAETNIGVNDPVADEIAGTVDMSSVPAGNWHAQVLYFTANGNNPIGAVAPVAADGNFDLDLNGITPPSGPITLVPVRDTLPSSVTVTPPDVRGANSFWVIMFDDANSDGQLGSGENFYKLLDIATNFGQDSGFWLSYADRDYTVIGTSSTTTGTPIRWNVNTSQGWGRYIYRLSNNGTEVDVRAINNLTTLDLLPGQSFTVSSLGTLGIETDGLLLPFER